CQGTHRVHRVGVRDQQEAGTIAGSRAAAAQAVSEPIAARQPLDAKPERGNARADECLHAIDGGRIVGRAFDAHPVGQLGAPGSGGKCRGLDNVRGGPGWVPGVAYWSDMASAWKAASIGTR